jgi:hypothetical protein
MLAMATKATKANINVITAAFFITVNFRKKSYEDFKPNKIKF